MNINLRQTPVILSLFLTVFTTSLLTSFTVQANASAGNKAQAKVIKPIDVEMKCHVELVGGGETISFTNTPYKSLKKLTKILMGKKVKITSDDPAREVYKVKECVPLEAKFVNSRAQELFLDTPR